MTNTQPMAKLVSKAELCAQLNVSPRTVENMVKGGRFPSPVQIGKMVYWSERAIQKWQHSMFAEQEAWSPY